MDYRLIIDDLVVPDVKQELLSDATEEVDSVWASYNMGLITNNERYNQIIDIWTRVDTRITETLMNEISSHKNGFNSVFMMLDSGARGSKTQIKQLAGIRGLMAKPENLALLEGVKLLRIQSYRTLKMGCQFLSTSFQLTVREKV